MYFIRLYSSAPTNFEMLHWVPKWLTSALTTEIEPLKKEQDVSVLWELSILDTTCAV